MKKIKIYQLQPNSGYTTVVQGEGGPDVSFQDYEVESVIESVEDKEVDKIKKNPRSFVHKGRVRNKVGVDAAKEIREKIDTKNKRKRKNEKMIAGSMIRPGDKKSRMIESIRKGE